MITYRKPTLNDAEELADARVRLINEDSGLDEHEKKDLYDRVKAYIRNSLDQDNFITVMAFDGDLFVGTASACLYSVLPGIKLPSGKNAYIQNVYVLPSHRRLGVGRELISMVINEAKRRGYTRITLHATELGSALFAKCGFQSSEKLGLTEMVYAHDE